MPGFAHDVTQGGNRRELVFFGHADYRAYLELLAFYAAKAGTQLIAWLPDAEPRAPASSSPVADRRG